MKFKDALFTVFLGTLLATSAPAIVYSDLDVFNGASGRLVTAANPLSGYFDINAQDNDGILDRVGYDSTNQQITRAIASFSIVDDNPFSWSDGSETVTINLGSSTFVNSHAATILFALGDVTGSALLDLNVDGIIKYTIAANSGDFKAIHGSLLANAEPKSVPDGGWTVVFLGIGFLGICALQWKSRLAC
jgi:hypothetical protein